MGQKFKSAVTAKTNAAMPKTAAVVPLILPVMKSTATTTANSNLTNRSPGLRFFFIVFMYLKFYTSNVRQRKLLHGDFGHRSLSSFTWLRRSKTFLSFSNFFNSREITSLDEAISAAISSWERLTSDEPVAFDFSLR